MQIKDGCLGNSVDSVDSGDAKQAQTHHRVRSDDAYPESNNTRERQSNFASLRKFMPGDAALTVRTAD